MSGTPSLDTVRVYGQHAGQQSGPAANEPHHGTRSRYRKELAAGVTPCEPCKRAERTYRARWRAARARRGESYT